LMAQFQQLQVQCARISSLEEEKSILEGQLQQLMKSCGELQRQNAEWQQEREGLVLEATQLRNRAGDAQQLESRLSQASQSAHQLAVSQQAEEKLRHELRSVQDELSAEKAARAAEADGAGSLRDMIEAMHEEHQSAVSMLEAELSDKRSYCFRLERTLETRDQTIDQMRQEASISSQAVSATQDDRSELHKMIEALKAENASLNAAVEQCVRKLQERPDESPFMVDKRLVIQMVIALVEQGSTPAKQHEIKQRMADSLGFTQVEREQIGVLPKAQRLSDSARYVVGGLADMFVEFLNTEAL